MRSRKRRAPIADINVVPYIDVMLVLLIIFMVTAPLLMQGVHVDLPEAKAKVMTSKKEPIIVSVDKKGEFYLNVADHPDRPITPRALANRVAAELLLDNESHFYRPVMIQGDKDVNYGRMMDAMVVLQKAGAKSVGLMTAPMA